MTGRLVLGTSGYDYPHWRSVFYPPELHHDRLLPFYAEHFGAVEVNATFYRLQSEETFRHWRDTTPRDFRFVLKGSRFLTHVKRLRDAEEPLRTFFGNAKPLGDKLDCVLWQLRPDMKADAERLASFCDALRREAPKVRHAFEFRERSWFSDTVYAVLRAHGHALVIAHSNRWPREEVLTTSWTYLRFHGGEGAYGSAYSERQLHYWADRAREWLGEGMDVYAFFNNDAFGHAVHDARRLGDMTAVEAAMATGGR